MRIQISKLRSKQIIKNVGYLIKFENKFTSRMELSKQFLSLILCCFVIGDVLKIVTSWACALVSEMMYVLRYVTFPAEDS